MFSEARLATLIPVRNMDRAVKFYTKALGGSVEFRAGGDMGDSWASLKLAGTDVWLIAPEKREKRTLAYSTFLVTDIRAAVGELKRKGVKFQRAQKMSPESTVEGPIAFEPWGAAAFFKDTEGNVLMIWQSTQPMGTP